MTRTAAARYWTMVRISLIEIFGMSRAEASRHVTGLRIVQAQGGASMSGYHIEPLRVAADLAGASINPSHLRQYLRFSAGSRTPARQAEGSAGVGMSKIRLSGKSAVKPIRGWRVGKSGSEETATQPGFKGAKAV